MFLAMFFFGIVGIAFVIAIPNPSYRDASDLAVRIMGYTGIVLIGAAYLTSLISFVSGVMAWFKGTQHCGWVFISAIVLFAPIIIMVASKLNL